jgi:NADH-quinone oxidoreductase subunit M
MLLPIVVGLPAGVALLLASVSLLLAFFGAPALPARVWRVVGLAAGLANFGFAAIGLGLGFDVEYIGFQSLQAFAWPPALGAELVLGVDGIGLCFLISTTGLVPLAMLASWRTVKDSIRSWVFVCLMLESSLLGALASIDLLSFVFFWALALIPVLLWLASWGGVGRARAASRVWAIESIGLACLLFVVFVLREASLEQFGFSTLGLYALSDERPQSLLDIRLAIEEQRLLFGVLVVALATRLPIVPLHFWLPATHAASPAGLSMLIATGFVQTAAIGILRFALPLFPEAASEAGPILSLLGIFALAYASLVALVQKELKRLVAYASVGYAGFALFGISTLNVQGLTGAVLQLLTHGLATAGLFVLIGVLSVRRDSTEVAAFGGLAKPMPVCASFFALMALSLMGLPLLGGFVGDLFVLLGSLETRRELSIVALLAMVVAASYLLWVQRRLFLGPVDEPANRGLIDLDRIERSILLAITIPIVWIGVYPNPVLRRIEPAVLEILYTMQRGAIRPEQPMPEAATELVVGDAIGEQLARGRSRTMR